MQDLAEMRRCISNYFARPFSREISDADDPFRFQDLDDFAQMIVAQSKQRDSLGRR